jgi:hypothetical protein
MVASGTTSPLRSGVIRGEKRYVEAYYLQRTRFESIVPRERLNSTLSGRFAVANWHGLGIAEIICRATGLDANDDQEL